MMAGMAMMSLLKMKGEEATTMACAAFCIPISIEALGVFLKKGHFSFKVSVISVIVQYVMLIILTSWAVRGSAKQAARMSPAEALRTVK